MAQVGVEIEFGTMENEDGYERECVSATCDRCGHTTESFGTGIASIKRCLVLLREECPNEESNFYKANPSDEIYD